LFGCPMTYPKSDPRKLKPIVKQLDSLVSKIVIASHGKCVTCSTRFNLVCGHYIRRGRFGTRWLLNNCHAQCVICNGIHETDIGPYKQFMLHAYGQGFLDHLESIADRTVKTIEQHAIYRELQEVAKQYGIHAPDIKETK
jgi:hypothetical protein